MNALILYFSGTGNTKHVVNKIKAELNELNVDAKSCSIEENFEIQPHTFDMLILGCPKYYEYLVLDFVKYLKENLPVSKNKIPTMFFCTQAGPLKTNFDKVEKILKKRNYILTSSKSFAFSNNMVIYDIFPITGDDKIKANLNNINKELKTLVANFVEGKQDKEKPNILYRGISYLSGIVFSKLFSAFQVKYSASDECTGCGLCTKRCPKQNIKMINNKPEFGKECILCMRCINICPENAILYKKKQRMQYKLNLKKIEGNV